MNLCSAIGFLRGLPYAMLLILLAEEVGVEPTYAAPVCSPVQVSHESESKEPLTKCTGEHPKTRNGDFLGFCYQSTHPATCLHSALNQHYTWVKKTGTRDYTRQIAAGRKWSGDCSEWAFAFAYHMRKAGQDVKLVHVQRRGRHPKHVYVKYNGVYFDYHGSRREIRDIVLGVYSLEQFRIRHNMGLI